MGEVVKTQVRVTSGGILATGIPPQQTEGEEEEHRNTRGKRENTCWCPSTAVLSSYKTLLGYS